MTRVEQEIRMANSNGIRLITTLSGEEFTVAFEGRQLNLSRAQAAALCVGLKRLIDDTGALSMLSTEGDRSDPDVRNEIDEICARLGVSVDWEDEE